MFHRVSILTVFSVVSAYGNGEGGTASADWTAANLATAAEVVARCAARLPFAGANGPQDGQPANPVVSGGLRFSARSRPGCRGPGRPAVAAAESSWSRCLHAHPLPTAVRAGVAIGHRASTSLPSSSDTTRSPSSTRFGSWEDMTTVTPSSTMRVRKTPTTCNPMWVSSSAVGSSA